MNFSEEDIHNRLEEIKHPFINCSLTELGIVKNISVTDNTVVVTFALPFPKIPIKDTLISSVKTALENLGAKVETKITIMNQEELQNFLDLEKKNWK
ncbi:MAG: iron-sulfur cluster assembly protein [Promethearchaeota archaeon]